MYSRCPHCDTQRQISTAQLQKSRGLLRCRSCGQRFDALASLVDDKRAGKKIKSTPSESIAPPWLANSDLKTAHRRWYVFGNAALLLLLLTQLLFFYGEDIARQSSTQQWAERFCGQNRCGLPTYRNLDAWVLSHGHLQSISPGRYRFSAALGKSNDTAEALPELQLTLLDYAGSIVAQRVFGSQHYLANGQELSPAAEIRLDLFVPNMQIGGFTYQLL